MPEPRYVGGQAVMEGVMMRGATTWAVSVRTPDGDIRTEVNEAPVWAKRWAKVPLARGVATLMESMSLGIRALTWSANQAVDPAERMSKGAMGGTVAFAIVFFSAVFIVFPALAARGMGGLLHGGFAFNFFEGVLRLSMFLGYIALIGRMPDIRRVFMYHGAEHKAIAAYENDVELTPESAQRFSTAHVRCGTNFLLTVMVVTILAYSVFGRPGWAVLIASRLLLIPVVAGGSYEIIRYAARNMGKPWVATAMKPGLALQRLTTRPPTDDQLEVAITSLKAVLSATELAEVEARPRVPRRNPNPGPAFGTA
ncbi:MAG: DUF1385 domain-containing protein [Actinomycetota bacterium]|nr:DUF1385 domain-containing protein [Actinomycetota bacterium]